MRKSCCDSAHDFGFACSWWTPDVRDIHLKVLEAKGIGAKGIPIQRYSKAKGIPIQRYSKAKGIWNSIFTSPKEP
jgi:hypothetical protein